MINVELRRTRAWRIYDETWRVNLAVMGVTMLTDVLVLPLSCRRVSGLFAEAAAQHEGRASRGAPGRAPGRPPAA